MKKFICSVLTILMIFTMIPNLGLASNTTRYEPSLSIKSQDLPSVDPGKTKTIQFNLKNSGPQAIDVTMTPVFGGDTPFIPNTLTDKISIGDVSGNSSGNVKFEIKADSNAKGGNYPVTLKFNYKYVANNETPLIIANATHEETVYVRVTGSTSQPQLIISEVTTNPEEITPGKDVKLGILFENKGTIEAENVKVRLEGLDNDKGFYISAGSDLAYMKKVPGGMISSIVFDLKAAKNVKSGTQQLEVVFNYGEKEERQKIYLNVKGAGNSESELSIENLEYPTGSISTNKDFVVKFDLKNNSDLRASNIIIKADSTDIAAVVPKSVGIRKLNSLDPGGSETFSFVFSPTDDSITRSYPINISVSYEDELNEGEENRMEVSQYVGINAHNPDKDDDKKSAPKLIIDKYSFEPTLVRAGEEFTMNLSFYNTNNSRSVKNIKIFLTADEIVDSKTTTSGGSVFTPVNTSNTFYIDSIPPKGRVEKRVTMFTVPDAKAKTYTMTANFEYEDSEAESFTATELIGVPVVQQSKLDIGELEYMSEAFVGQSTPISLEFYNTGKVSLSNMMVKLEGDFQTENAQLYLGNFESGNSEFFEGYVIPNEPGPLKGDVVFTYEDSTGEEQEIRKEFNLNVVDMPLMDEDFPMDNMDGKPKGIIGLLKSPILWIGLIAAAVITGIVIKKKKNKKEEELSLDE